MDPREDEGREPEMSTEEIIRLLESALAEEADGDEGTRSF